MTIPLFLVVLALICFFLGGISSYVERLPAINWIAWGLFCGALAVSILLGLIH